jgi:hypothetical protein
MPVDNPLLLTAAAVGEGETGGSGTGSVGGVGGACAGSGHAGGGVRGGVKLVLSFELRIPAKQTPALPGGFCDY